MKYVKYAVLALLTLAALSLCGTAVLWIMGKILHLTFDNLLFAGFKVGLVACVLLALSELWKKRHPKKV
ncbi:MAG: hypothetical protein J6K72_08840 [Clostridia bacterium]|nr:hypothetical protein [Clostridia bacterium]